MLFSLVFVLLVLAAICFLLTSAGVPSTINLTALGLLFATIAALAFFYPRL